MFGLLIPNEEPFKSIPSNLIAEGLLIGFSGISFPLEFFQITVPF